MKVPKDFGNVIRRDALAQKSINLSLVIADFNFVKNYDDSLEFVSLCPFCGSDNADDCMRSLERHGLVYIDDFLFWKDTFQIGAGLKYLDLMAPDQVLAQKVRRGKIKMRNEPRSTLICDGKTNGLIN
ncbi:hypothetical protein [Xylophilus ampelinus]|uniref:hypothetical protein n=1 Tax=Xylophilus ampelinus TaxID=54067 RepID=UPI0011B3B80D|nr:hypothetical protein [Xylophilus ampelinus]MCS4511916.1 hypothetical protein [Xylophilus ampelinus]